MLYFRHSELVKRYHISLKTVHNWIDAAKHGKIDLKLHKQGGRTYIVNSPGNITALERLVEQGKKYRNTRYHKVVTPKPVFYELYSRRQILDIISNLNIHREIPRQYNYMDGGADNWDKYAQRMFEEESANQLKSTVELLHANLGSIDLLLDGHKRVNVIDVGVGNALPVRELLEHLSEKGLLHRYIAVDISEAMLHIAKRNIKQWFGERVEFEGHVRDMTFERFDNLLIDDMLSRDAEQTINLVLLLGGTLPNLRTPADMLRAIYGSMGYDDIFVYTAKPDSETSRRFFKTATKPDGAEALPPIHGFILGSLDIDESLYDIEMGFNEHKRMRYTKIRLKTALTINFRFDNGERGVHFEKGDTILLWRAWHLSAPEIVAEFEKTGFALLQSSITKDREYLLTISGIDTKPGLE